VVIEDPKTRVLVTSVVMLAALLQILDTTIVTVALPRMQGQLGASAEQMGWVLTSYLIASGIFMPLTGLLTDRFGQRNYLVLSIAGFVAASMLCGLATSLDEIVLFRLLQGVAGAGLVPSAQAILVNIFPRAQRGQAMAIFGVGAMVGPILGPTLGGYLTQVLNWRWTFFVNLPVGALALMGVLLFVPDTERRERHADWLGFAFLALAIASMQYVLDRGQQYGWFSSHVIQIGATISVFAFICLILRNWEMGRDAIFDLRVFADRNFAVSAVILATFMFSMYGVLDLQPLMLETSLGYPAFTTGLLLAPRGLGSMVAMLLAGRLLRRVDPRWLILCGIGITVFSTWVTTWYTLDVDAWWITWPIVVQGFGLGMVFVPLATVSFATLPADKSAEGAGVRQLSRTVGASLGVSVGSAVMADSGQAAWNHLGGNITPFSDAVSRYLQPLGLNMHDPRAGAVLAHELGQQAHFIGLLHAFGIMAITVVIGLPLLLLVSREAGH